MEHAPFPDEAASFSTLAVLPSSCKAVNSPVQTCFGGIGVARDLFRDSFDFSDCVRLFMAYVHRNFTVSAPP